MSNISRLQTEYIKKRPAIRKRLEQFETAGDGPEKEIFAELCFCILTPQTRAVSCDAAIKELKKERLLLSGTKREIARTLRGRIRFHNNKASFIVHARERLKQSGILQIKPLMESAENIEVREWLVKNIKGLGYKEASHFLRNIGHGKDIAIIDRHVIRNLQRLGLVKDAPGGLSGKRYRLIEEEMRKFSRCVGIPTEELDLLFWSRETGFIFK